MSNIVINLAAEYTGNKVFKKAGKDVFDLEKSVKKLAKTFGIALSAQAVVNFGKASLKAFSEDQKAAVLLANSVKNLGLEMENPRISEFITNLSKSAAVADDELRPAMQKLLTTTGSVSKSQQLLSDAINISRGSGIDLATVAQDLSNAYVGNTKGLKKYNLGLTQAELKGSSFLEIQTKLNKQFSGANAAYLDTYAGKMDALTVAAGEAQETIGKGLVDSLVILAGTSTGIDGVTSSMEDLSKQIADTFTGFSVLIKKLEDSKGVFGFLYGFFKDMTTSSLNLYTISKFLAGNAPYQEDPNSLQARQHAAYGGATARSAAEIAAEKRNKELEALLKKQVNAQKALTAEQKKQAALKKAGSIFDMEQIQIIAALKGNISADERKRLELQLAIATGNEEQAKKLTYQLAISQGLTVKLAQELASMPMANNPFAAWAGYLDAIELKAKRIIGLSGGTITGSEDIPHGNVAPTAMSSIASGGTALRFDSSGNIVVNVNGSVISEDDLISAILDGIQKKSLSGSPSTIARIQGMFG